MCEYDEVLWCEKCQDYKAFTVSAVGTRATCLVCETMVRGQVLIKLRERQFAHEVSDWIFEPLKRIVKKQIDIARKI